MTTSGSAPSLPAAIAVYVGVVVGWVVSFLLALLWDPRFARLPWVLAAASVCGFGCVLTCWLPRRRLAAGAALPLVPWLLMAVIPLPHLLGDPWMVRQLGSPTRQPEPLALGLFGVLFVCAAFWAAWATVRARGGGANHRPLLLTFGGVHALVVLVAVGTMTLHGAEERFAVADTVLPEPITLVEKASGAELAWTRVWSRTTDRPYETAVYRFERAGELALSPTALASRLTFSCADENARRQHLLLAPLGVVHRDRCGATLRVSSGEAVVFEQDLDLSREVSIDVPLSSLAPGDDLRLGVAPDLGCSVLVHRLRAAPPRESPRRVVLISLDTHAAQHMRFGPGNTSAIDTSPNLRSLVESDDLAVGFTHAIASADWTLPSHASVWTGLRPSQHRLFLREPVTSFDERIETIPQLLRDEAGVRTIALLSHLRLGPDYGFARGVEYASLYDEELGLRGRRVVGDALALLDEHRDDDLLLFVHLFDAHTPYTNYPDGYEELIDVVEPLYPERLYTGRFYRETVLGNKGLDPRTRPRNLGLHGARFLPAMDASRVAYQLGIRDVDDMLGVLLDGLRERGLYDSTDLVLFSDHGEEFFGHGLLTHTSVYLENLRVPLVVKLRQDSPHAMAARAAPDYNTSSFEAHPTVFRVVLDLFGVGAPDQVTGEGGLGLGELLTLGADRLAVSELHHAPYSDLVQLSAVCGRDAHGIVSAYLEDGGASALDPVFHELFAPVHDPDEQHNLAPRGRTVDDPCLSIALDRAHELGDSPYRSRTTRGLTDDEVERLRALGYLE